MLVALPGDYGKPRPAVVVQGDAITGDGLGSVVVCPLTTHLTNAFSFRVAVEPAAGNGLRQVSEVMVEKLAGVPRSWLRDVVGRFDQGSMRAVDHALLLVLGFA